MYEIFIETHFSAAHCLRGYDGDCAKLHGHNWIIEVHVLCKELNSIGIGIDFKDIKKLVKNILSKLDHSNLNELPEFTDVNPSSENISVYVYKQLETSALAT